MLPLLELKANATGVNAKVIPYRGGEAYFSIDGNFDGGVAKLVVSQTDDPPVYRDANFTTLTGPGGYRIKLGQNHVLALDFSGGGGAIDLKYTLEEVKDFTRAVQ